MYPFWLLSSSKRILILLSKHKSIPSIDVTFHESSSFFSSSPEHSIIPEAHPLPYISPSKDVPSHPLQVYHRQLRSDPRTSLVDTPTDSPPAPMPVPTTDPPLIDSPPTKFEKVFAPLVTLILFIVF